MALKKVTTTPFGISGDYLKITGLTWEARLPSIDNGMRVEAVLYANVNARTANAQPLYNIVETVPAVTITPEMIDFQDPVRMGYLMLKSLGAYKDAVDC